MSEFWSRKIRTHFDRFDFDKDGVISQKDCELMVKRFSEKENADSRRSEEIRKTVVSLYSLILKATDAGHDVLKEDMFVSSMKIMRNTPEFEMLFTSVCRGLFEIMDTNKDGVIQEDEHRRWFENLGVPDTSFTKTAFKAIDTNGDGVLSYEEFISAFLDFLSSEDEKSPNQLFLGQLVPAKTKNR